jgi:hypothetical protein
MSMRLCTSAAALLATFALAGPVQAQEKVQEWTPATLKPLLGEMGYKVTQDKPAGKDYLIAVSAPNGGLPINIYGTRCTPKDGSIACPGADFVTGFKVKNDESKQAAVSKLTAAGLKALASKSSPAVTMEIAVDFSAGMTKDEIKAKFAEYQKTADAAFNTLKAAGLLAN